MIARAEKTKESCDAGQTSSCSRQTHATVRVMMLTNGMEDQNLGEVVNDRTVQRAGAGQIELGLIKLVV